MTTLNLNAMPQFLSKYSKEVANINFNLFISPSDYEVFYII